VAESLRDHVHRLFSGQQSRAMRVPQVMKPDHRQRLVAELGAAAGDVTGELPGHVLRVAVVALVKAFGLGRVVTRSEALSAL
jgi:hypothetical protein